LKIQVTVISTKTRTAFEEARSHFFGNFLQQASSWRF